jgi:peroxiredoxin
MINIQSKNWLKSPLIYVALCLTLSFCAQNNGNQATQDLFAATFPDQNGQLKALKPYIGKIVVLNFWATWCEPCREEMPELSSLHDAYKDKNVVVLGVAVDDVGNISEFSKQTKISYPLFAADDAGMSLAANLGNSKSVLPFTVIIKADGSVAKTYFGRVTKPLLEQALLPLMNNAAKK